MPTDSRAGGLDVDGTGTSDMAFDAFEAGAEVHAEPERYSAGQAALDDQLQYEQVRLGKSRYSPRTVAATSEAVLTVYLVHFRTLVMPWYRSWAKFNIGLKHVVGLSGLRPSSPEGTQKPKKRGPVKIKSLLLTYIPVLINRHSIVNLPCCPRLCSETVGSASSTLSDEHSIRRLG